jgi:NAD(P)H dehydrogenase (quinone)
MQPARPTSEIQPLATVLILYFSRHGRTEQLARLAARGVEHAGGIAKLRSVPSLDGSNAASAPEATLDDVREADALMVGSPTRFGSMAASMQAFFEQTTPLWLSAALADKPAAAFTSTATVHGGNESTLLDILRPLLHHGMFVVGLPYSHAELNHTPAGGAPYGASSVSGAQGERALTDEARSLALALGKRVAALAQRLKACPMPRL